MFKRMISIVLRLLAVLLSGVVLAVIGIIAGVIVIGSLSPLYALIFGREFSFFGAQGYEAGGPIGFILGALTGLIASSVRLFRRQAAK